MHNVAAPSKQDRERIRVKRSRSRYLSAAPSAATDKRKIRMGRPLHAENVIIEFIVVIPKRRSQKYEKENEE